MKFSFSNVLNQRSTRYHGGTVEGIAEPYVTGYHHIHWLKLPDIAKITIEGSSGKLGREQCADLLSASCLSVTPPGGTLNKVSFTGLGGTKWAVPGSIDYGDSVSIKFLEYSGLPVTQIFHSWVKSIRDYRTGVTSNDLKTGKERDGYSKKKYAGTLLYWTTAPDGVTVEYSACYAGVFPLKDPQDLFSSDVENVGKIEPEIEFNVDYVWHEDWVFTKAQGLSDAKVTSDFSDAVKKQFNG